MFKKLTAAVFWSGIASLANTVATLIIFAVLAVELGPRPIGLASMAIVFVAIANRLSGDELTDGLIKKEKLDELDKHTMFWIMLTCGAVSTAFLFLLAHPISWLFDEVEIIPFIQVLAIIPILSSSSAVQKAILRKEFRFRTIATRSFVANLAAGLLAVTLAFSGAGAWSLVLFQVFAALFSTTLMWLTGAYSPAPVFDKVVARSFFGTASVMSASRVLSFAEEHAPRILIGYLMGAHALGVFMLAWNMLISLRRLILSSLSHVLAVSAAQIVTSKDDQTEKLQKAFDHSIEMPAILALPMYTGFAVISPIFFAVFFGDAWIVTSELTQYLAFGFAAAIAFLVPLELMRGTSKSRLQPFVLGLAFMSVTFAILYSYQYGLGGIAIALTVHFCIFAIISNAAQATALRIAAWPVMTRWLRLAATAILMSIIVHITMIYLRPHLEPPEKLAASVGIGVLAYASLLPLLAQPTFRLLLRTFASMKFIIKKNQPAQHC